MGMIKIELMGSFGTRRNTFAAQTRGHAHAIAEAMEWLARCELPRAIRMDHDLHDEDERPADGFGRAPNE